MEHGEGREHEARREPVALEEVEHDGVAVEHLVRRPDLPKGRRGSGRGRRSSRRGSGAR